MATLPYGVASTRGGMSGYATGGPAAYGSRPKPTTVPLSAYQETQAADPGLVGLGDQGNSVIKGQLEGKLSPETLNSLRDNAATFGVTSGMPGSQLSAYGGLRNLGLNVEQMQNQGLGNYLNALKSVGSMQLDPNLVSNIGTYNNQIAAAPDPAAAAAEEERLWQSHYDQTRSPAGGTGSFSGTRPMSASGGGGFGLGGSSGGYKAPASNWWDSSSPMQVYGPTGVETPATSNWNTATAGNYGAGISGGGESFMGSPYVAGSYGEPSYYDPNYDGMLDPNSPDYQPQGAE